MQNFGASIGLCATCAHCRIVRSARSAFYLCQRSLTDPNFEKYPSLPMICCSGHELATADAAREPPAG
jgi:hypothetical protein